MQDLIKHEIEQPVYPNGGAANGHSAGGANVRRIVAGVDADDDTARRRLEATAKLLEVAGTPRGNHLSASTPRDVRSAESALQDFIEAHGGGAEGLDALQQLMAASVASKAAPPPPKPPVSVRPPRDPPATYQAPPMRQHSSGGNSMSDGRPAPPGPIRLSSATGGGDKAGSRLSAGANGGSNGYGNGYANGNGSSIGGKYGSKYGSQGSDSASGPYGSSAARAGSADKKAVQPPARASSPAPRAASPSPGSASRPGVRKATATRYY